MAPRKCLLLTYHFPPSGAVAVYRMLGLVHYLPKYGWQPIVVAPPRVPWEPEDASLLTQVPPATLVERVPFAQGFAGKIARHLAPETHWLLKANRVCQRLIRAHRPEAIITSSPPGEIHLLGLWLSRRNSLPLIADFRDPWVSNHPIRRWTIRLRFDRWLEGKVMRGATRLVANTPGNQRGWEMIYPQAASKMLTITNGYDPERFPPIGAPKPRSERVTILHAGELYSGRDPRPFLDALQSLPALPIDVEFLGRCTDVLYDFPTEIQRRGLSERVRLAGQAPYAQALERMMCTGILLLIHTPEYRVGIPAKLYEYLGTGRPVLALAEPDSDLAWVLREAKVLHRVAAPLNVAAIQQALIELTQAVQDGRPTTPDLDALRQFTRERMAQRFATCLDGCVSPANLKGTP